MKPKTIHKCDNMSIYEIIKYNSDANEWYVWYKGEIQDITLEYCYVCGERLPVNLKRFIVGVREVWIQTYEVYCDNKEDALTIIDNMDEVNPVGDPEYSHRLPKEHWTANEVSEENS